MATNDGGRAFPRPFSALHEDDIHPAQRGMSLRDYLAAHAPPLPDVLWPLWVDGVHSERNYAREVTAVVAMWRYDYADAMLAEREKPAP